MGNEAIRKRNVWNKTADVSGFAGLILFLFYQSVHPESDNVVRVQRKISEDSLKRGHVCSTAFFKSHANTMRICMYSMYVCMYIP